MALISVDAKAQSLSDGVTNLDSATAATVQPYSQMACAAYEGCDERKLSSLGYVRDISWQDAMKRAGVGQSTISDYERAGFSANIYRNDRLKEIVIAYRGSEGSIIASWAPYQIAKFQEKMGIVVEGRLIKLPSMNDEKGDWQTDFRARDLKSASGRLEAQYVAARSLASRIEKSYSETAYKDYAKNLSLTGQSLGGALASYAGQFKAGASVYTIEPARNLLAGTGPNPRQINVMSSGDPVSDPKGLGKVAGPASLLPGRTLAIKIPFDVYHPVQSLKARHDAATAAAQIASIAGTNEVKLSTKPSASPNDRSTGSPQPGNTAAAISPSSNTSGSLTVRSQTTTPSVQTHAALTGFASPSRTATGISQPGGISLTKAAAERMPLNLSIEGAFVKDGRIVLSGRKDTEATIDAALFLTALRATCEGRDPYFSLDPDDTALWLLDTKKAGEELFAHIKKDTEWTLQQKATRKTPSILKFRTFSASQDYPVFWSSTLQKYPNLRSRLVFGPEWLRQTRFGEILYKADVLLKELAGGAPALGTNSVRAAKIDDYISATQITAAKGLLFKYHNLSARDTALVGGRIWYDLTETSDAPTTKAESIPTVSSELSTLLRKRRLLPGSLENFNIPVSLPQNDGLLDISQVYPRMYVRIRDPLTLRDATGSFPGVDELVAGANAAPKKYAAAYREYQALVEVFRAYVAAVHARRMEPRLCLKLPKDLMDAEKIAVAMPAYHRTDLALTVAWYEYSEGRFRRAIGMTSGLYQGGVSVGATALFKQTAANAPDTPILRELRLEASKTSREPISAGAENLRYISFTLDPEETEATRERKSPQPSLANVATKPEAGIKDASSPALSGTIGRFDLHNGGRIQGENLASVPLNSQFSKSANLAQNECAQLCSDDKECIAFEIDERRSICGTYSSITKIIPTSSWTHGIWK